MIRRAEATDCTAIADLENRAFEIESSHIYQPPETQSLIMAAMKRNIYFVAVDSQGDLIGCVLVNPERLGIFQLAVEPSQRRQGYGRRLMEEAETYGKEAGWPGVLIGILDFRKELFPYYRKLGYRETGEKKKPVLLLPARLIQDCELIMMSKTLI